MYGFIYPIGDLFIRAWRMLCYAPCPLHGEEACRPFFVVGAARSGATLLRRILQASPEVHIPPEVKTLGRAISFFRRNRNMRWEHLVYNVIALFEFHPEADALGVSLRPLAQRLVGAPPEMRSLAFILDSFYRFHGDQKGETFTRWGDKTPGNVRYMDRIRAVFPDAKFVCMIRDGVDAISSSLEAGIRKEVANATKKWLDDVRKMRSCVRRRPRICFSVRYEDLVSNPQAMVQGVCEFLDIGFSPEMVERLDHVDAMSDLGAFEHHSNAGKPISTASIGKGRRAVSAEDRAIIQRLAGSELQALGYEPAV